MVRHLLTHTAGLVGDDQVFDRVSHRLRTARTSLSSLAPSRIRSLRPTRGRGAPIDNWWPAHVTAS